MNISVEPKQFIFGQSELDHIKQKTNQLKRDLEENNLDDALLCINEINEVNSKNFYELIGKLTRGLHMAISDLDISSTSKDTEKNTARMDLKYVIKVTHDAAAKTLDMTEQAMDSIREVKSRQESQETMISNFLAENETDPAVTDLLNRLRNEIRENSGTTEDISRFTSEIIIAQNFQDLASQSISKIINIISEVESSLVTLTQYTNLLKKLSRFGTNGVHDFDDLDSESLKSDIDKLNAMENEHLDQNEVDNLLSNLGF